MKRSSFVITCRFSKGKCLNIGYAFVPNGSALPLLPQVKIDVALGGRFDRVR